SAAAAAPPRASVAAAGSRREVPVAPASAASRGEGYQASSTRPSAARVARPAARAPRGELEVSVTAPTVPARRDGPVGWPDASGPVGPHRRTGGHPLGQPPRGGPHGPRRGLPPGAAAPGGGAGGGQPGGPHRPGPAPPGGPGRP